MVQTAFSAVFGSITRSAHRNALSAVMYSGQFLTYALDKFHQNSFSSIASNPLDNITSHYVSQILLLTQQINQSGTPVDLVSIQDKVDVYRLTRGVVSGSASSSLVFIDISTASLSPHSLSSTLTMTDTVSIKQQHSTLSIIQLSDTVQDSSSFGVSFKTVRGITTSNILDGLATPNGPLEVFQLAPSPLIFTQPVSDDIILTDVGALSSSSTPSADSEIHPLDTVLVTSAIGVFDLILISDALNTNFFSASNSFVPTDLALASRTFNKIASDNFNLLQFASRTFSENLIDFLSPFDNAQATHAVSASDTITLTDSNTVDRYRGALNTFILTDTVGLNLSRTFATSDSFNPSDTLVGINGHIVDSFVLSDLVNVTQPQNVVDTLNFLLNDFVEIVHPEVVSDTVTLSDVFIVNKSSPTSNILLIADVVTTNNLISRSITDGLLLSDRTLAISPSSGKPCLEVYNVVPALGSREKIKLTFPFIFPSITLDLRNPIFGNSDLIKTHTKIRRTRSGQLSIVRALAWPTIETLTMRFTALSKIDADSLLTFVEQSAGLEVGYLDHENRQWRGFITDPQVSESQVGIDCQYTTGFSFRGVLA